MIADDFGDFARILATISHGGRRQTDNSTGSETQNVPALTIMILMIMTLDDDYTGYVLAK